MRVALICTDKSGLLQVRKDNRDAHLAYIAASGVVELAGPFLNEAGDMTGSMIVLNVATLEDANAWAAADPYALAGLFEAVQITEWKKAVG